MIWIVVIDEGSIADEWLKPHEISLESKDHIMKLQLHQTKHIPGVGLVVEQETGDLYRDYRLTDAGITDDTSGWWYFLRKYEDKENPYWYRKMRKPPTKENPNGEVVEEYVGVDLPFSVPRAWVNKLRRRASS